MPSFLESGDAAVAAGSPMAAHAAADCLRMGGNAVDAAVSASAVQCVTEPGSCGLGGDLFALVHSDEEGTWALTGSGRAPLRIEEVLEGQVAPRFGALSPSVPGTPSAWDLMLNRFGSMSIKAVLAPAIRSAVEGFPLYGLIPGMLERTGKQLEPNSALRNLFDGNPSNKGSLFKQKALGATLRAMAEDGIGSFYRGSIAESIVSDSQKEGGVLSLEDFYRHKVEFVEPLVAEFGNMRVLTQPPVSMGLVLLMELMLLEKLQPKSISSYEPEDIDLLVRCKHAAFSDGLAALETGIPENWLEDTAEEIYSRRIEGSTWSPSGSDTTCVVVSDGHGMVVSIIHSLFNEFGSRQLLPNSGIIMNDRLANNLIGIDGLRGGDRAIHTLHSYLLVEDGIPRAMGCTPGGRGQVQINFQVICRMIMEGMDVRQAIDEPRWLSGNPRQPYPKDTLYLEDGIHPAMATALESKGHSIHTCNANDVDMFGSCLVTGFDKESSKWYAVADGRRDAVAIAINGGA